MHHKFIRSRFTRAVLVIAGFFIFDLALNYTLYNPSFITPLYGLAQQYHLLPTFADELILYPLTSIREVNWGLYPKPRLMVDGVVSDVVKADDGDWHVDVTAADGTLVTEFIPEYPLTIPNKGQHIKIWGISRFDIEHRWWEIHPVIGWKAW